jgi:AcrR family transcriptional regulator
MATRREILAEAATDYVLEHGLLGLSLRPLAAALGTSDRMLLYHFADKDDLVATVLRVANDRAVTEIERLPAAPDVRAAVVAFWPAFTTGRLACCQRIYVQAAAAGLLGGEPYTSLLRDGNERWEAALAAHLERSGCAPARSRRAVVVLDAAFMGLELDLPLDRHSAEVEAAVGDGADAVAAVAAGAAGPVVTPPPTA